MPQFPATEGKKDFPIRRAATRAHFNLLCRESRRRKVENLTVPLLESFRSSAGNGLVRGIRRRRRRRFYLRFSAAGFLFPCGTSFARRFLLVAAHSDALVYYLQV